MSEVVARQPRRARSQQTGGAERALSPPANGSLRCCRARSSESTAQRGLEHARSRPAERKCPVRAKGTSAAVTTGRAVQRAGRSSSCGRSSGRCTRAQASCSWLRVVAAQESRSSAIRTAPIPRRKVSSDSARTAKRAVQKGNSRSERPAEARDRGPIALDARTAAAAAPPAARPLAVARPPVVAAPPAAAPPAVARRVVVARRVMVARRVVASARRRRSLLAQRT